MTSVAMTRSLEQCTIHNTEPLSFDGRIMRARVIDIYDGDTVTVATEAFPGRFVRLSIRLKHINAAEMRGGTPSTKAAAVAARNHLLWLITRAHFDLEQVGARDITHLLNSVPYIVYVRCHGTDKYGRTLGELFRDPLLTDPSINDSMVANGFAVPYMDDRGPAARPGGRSASLPLPWSPPLNDGGDRPFLRRLCCGSCDVDHA